MADRGARAWQATTGRHGGESGAGTCMADELGGADRVAASARCRSKRILFFKAAFHWRKFNAPRRSLTFGAQIHAEPRADRSGEMLGTASDTRQSTYAPARWKNLRCVKTTTHPEGESGRTKSKRGAGAPLGASKWNDGLSALAGTTWLADRTSRAGADYRPRHPAGDCHGVRPAPDRASVQQGQHDVWRRRDDGVLRLIVVRGIPTDGGRFQPATNVFRFTSVRHGRF